MKVTVWGDAGGPNTAAAHRNRCGLTEACAYRELALELPPGGIALDADHRGERLGEAIYLELGEDERLRVVAVLDDDRLAQVEQNVFFSPLLQMRGDGNERSFIARSAELIGLSLTYATARVAAHPLTWREGDLRSPVDRHGWPSGWQGSEPLLARALTWMGSDWRARTRTASRIADRRNVGVIAMTGGAYLVGDQLIAPHTRQRPAGTLRHGPPGRVLRVS